MKYEKILYHSQFGTFQLVSDDYYIKEIRFCKQKQENDSRNNSERDKIYPKVMIDAASQLTEYLNGTRKDFTIPTDCEGTAFQQSVWDTLKKIPYGETRSYSQIAAVIGRPNAVRAVGGACGKNPVLIMVPCHRVLGKNGTLTGFSAGIELKKKLLQLERRP